MAGCPDWAIKFANYELKTHPVAFVSGMATTAALLLLVTGVGIGASVSPFVLASEQEKKEKAFKEIFDAHVNGAEKQFDSINRKLEEVAEGQCELERVVRRTALDNQLVTVMKTIYELEDDIASGKDTQRARNQLIKMKTDKAELERKSQALDAMRSCFNGTLTL